MSEDSAVITITLSLPWADPEEFTLQIRDEEDLRALAPRPAPQEEHLCDATPRQLYLLGEDRQRLIRLLSDEIAGRLQAIVRRGDH